MGRREFRVIAVPREGGRWCCGSRGGAGGGAAGRHLMDFAFDRARERKKLAAEKK